MIPKPWRKFQSTYGDEKKLLLAETKEKALQGADALVICTEWHNFRAPDFDALAKRVKRKSDL